jgi:hypothetical protein
MSDEQIKFWLLVWGAGLSTLLGLLKLWEVFWRDRTKLSTTYSFTGAEGVNDQIIVVNLSSNSVQVSRWSLAWKPQLFRFDKAEEDLTPDEGGGRFMIGPKSEHALLFSEDDKFDWGWKAATGRNLYLDIYLYDRRRPLKLRVKSGVM